MSRFKKCVAAVAVAAAIGGGSPAVASAAPAVPSLSSTTPEQRSQIRDGIGSVYLLLRPYVPAQYKDEFEGLYNLAWGFFMPPEDASAEYARMKAELPEIYAKASKGIYRVAYLCMLGGVLPVQYRRLSRWETCVGSAVPLNRLDGHIARYKN